MKPNLAKTTKLAKLARFSSSCSSEKKIFLQSVFWVRNILPRGFIGLLTKMAKKVFDHPGHVLAVSQKGEKVNNLELRILHHV